MTFFIPTTSSYTEWQSKLIIPVVDEVFEECIETTTNTIKKRNPKGKDGVSIISIEIIPFLFRNTLWY